MQAPRNFTENVSLKFRLYSGLLTELPYDYAVAAAEVLSLFSRFCRQGLEDGRHPREIVTDFFATRLGVRDTDTIRDRLFDVVHFIERQIAVFDAVEDATFTRTRDMEDVGTVHEARGRIATHNLASAARALFIDFGVRIVLTAHPTQFYTEPVLGILSELQTAIREDRVHEIYDLLLQLGHTRFSKKEKPRPYDEARGVLWFMERVLYDVVPRVQKDLLALAEVHDADALHHRPLLEIGFWPGGDRDGNPFIDAETTGMVGEMLRRSILTLYLRDVERLQARLTFEGVLERLARIVRRLELSAGLEPRDGTRRAAALTRAASDAPAHHASAHGAGTFAAGTSRAGTHVAEAHDAGTHVAEAHDAGAHDAGAHDEFGNTPYRNATELHSDLVALRAELVDRHNGLFLERLDAVILKVRAFGFHFAAIDLRQDSRVLAQAAELALQLVDPALTPFTELDQEQRLARLVEVRETTVCGVAERVLEYTTDPVLRDCFAVFSAARTIQNRNGHAGLHRFIISNTRGPADVMTVRFLALCSGYTADDLPLDIVPLFETVDDLSHARAVMERLWGLDLYRKHVEHRGGVQYVMLGFSDGTKDGGYLSANWQIYRAKQTLTALSREAGYRLVFFDGRGGPPARGGGNTHKFYRSMGRDVEGRTIHLTIQGQTISSMYGTPDAARYNVEQLTTAVLDNCLYPQTEDWHLNAVESDLLDELSDISYRAYRTLRDHPDFLAYLEHLSPLKYYGEANNSSRPAKRHGSGPLTLEDLRAIPFVGAWSQLKLNIPGYFGLGTALERMDEAGRLNELRDLYRGSLYFRTLIENSMQSLSKVYLPLTAWNATDARFGALHRIIVDEAQRTRALILKVSGQDELLGQDALNRASIALREELILPIAVIQQYALALIREHSSAPLDTTDADEQRGSIKALEKLVIKTMAAGVNAARNSV